LPSLIEGYFGEHYAKFVTFRYNGVVFPADWSSKATWEAFYSKVQFSTKFLYLHQVSEDEVIACLEFTVENKKTKERLTLIQSAQDFYDTETGLIVERNVVTDSVSWNKFVSWIQ